MTFRFYDDELFSITVVYDPRLVEGLTNADIIDAVSGVYGPATLSLPAERPAAASAGSIFVASDRTDGEERQARLDAMSEEFRGATAPVRHGGHRPSESYRGRTAGCHAGAS